MSISTIGWFLTLLTSIPTAVALTPPLCSVLTFSVRLSLGLVYRPVLTLWLCRTLSATYRLLDDYGIFRLLSLSIIIRLNSSIILRINRFIGIYRIVCKRPGNFPTQKVSLLGIILGFSDGRNLFPTNPELAGATFHWVWLLKRELVETDYMMTVES